MIRTSWQRRKYALAVRLSPPQLRAYFRDFRLTLVCLNCRFGRAEALADSAKSVAQKRRFRPTPAKLVVRHFSK